MWRNFCLFSNCGAGTVRSGLPDWANAWASPLPGRHFGEQLRHSRGRALVQACVKDSRLLYCAASYKPCVETALSSSSAFIASLWRSAAIMHDRKRRRDEALHSVLEVDAAGAGDANDAGAMLRRLKAQVQAHALGDGPVTSPVSVSVPAPVLQKSRRLNLSTAAATARSHDAAGQQSDKPQGLGLPPTRQSVITAAGACCHVCGRHARLDRARSVDPQPAAMARDESAASTVHDDFLRDEDNANLQQHHNKTDASALDGSSMHPTTATERAVTTTRTMAGNDSVFSTPRLVACALCTLATCAVCVRECAMPLCDRFVCSARSCALELGEITVCRLHDDGLRLP